MHHIKPLACLILLLIVCAAPAQSPKDTPKPETIALPDDDRKALIAAQSAITLSDCMKANEDLKAQLRIAQSQIKLRLGPEYEFNYRDMQWHLVKAATK